MTRTAYLDHGGPIPLSHKGFSLEGLENSMTAFAAAVDLGFRYLETDVHATSDGVVVPFHDERLEPVTNGFGPVAELPWSTVSRALIRGVEPVPRLEDVLGTWPQLRVNIDIKSPGAVVPLVRVVERTKAHERVCITSFSDRRRLAALRRLGRPVATSAGRTTVTKFVAAAYLRGGLGEALVAAALRGVDCLQVPERYGPVPVVTPRSLAAAHGAGVPVHVWTVNDVASMERLLDMGVDGIVTDRADLLKELLIARGTW